MRRVHLAGALQISRQGVRWHTGESAACIRYGHRISIEIIRGDRKAMTDKAEQQTLLFLAGDEIMASQDAHCHPAYRVA